MRKELSQAEIWDDSALVESWDDALAEYKAYHSIEAKGEDLEAAVAALQAQDNVVESAETESVEDGEVPDDETPNEVHPNGAQSSEGISALPDANLLPEESLKDLMISWYWAGYYTGYYQGQQSKAA